MSTRRFNSARLLLIVAILLVMGGCGLTQGTVVAKNHEPAYTSWIVIWTGKSSVLLPRFVPECWRITIHHDEATDSFCVTPDLYDSVTLGDHMQKP